MAFSFAGWLIVLGILGASSLIIAKRPDAKQMIDKIVPYQGWFGAASVFYGIFDLLQSVLGMGLMSVKPPIGLIYWILWLASGLLQISLGLLLGVGVIKTFIKDPTAQAKMDQTIVKLSPFQGTLGFISIGVGVGFLVMNFLL
jgi:hypothetical protein